MQQDLPPALNPRAHDFAALDMRALAVRAFNRFYTRRIGVLGERLWQTPFSLSEARVLFELGQRDHWIASELGRELNLDPGYLSRILRGFEEQGLISKSPSPSDGRQMLLALTARGREVYEPMNQASQAESAGLLERLSEAEQRRLMEAMGTIEHLLGDRPRPAPTVVFRDHRPGAQEYGWDGTFEALIAEIVAKFITKFDRSCERCWIAEIDGEIVGSVFVVRKNKTTAQLRMLYVESKARGLGVGRRLVEECIRFARDCGYTTIILWTNDILVAARRIYESVGFRLVKEEPHRSFGHDLVGQYWSLKL